MTPDFGHVVILDYSSQQQSNICKNKLANILQCRINFPSPKMIMIPPISNTKHLFEKDIVHFFSQQRIIFLQLGTIISYLKMCTILSPLHENYHVVH